MDQNVGCIEMADVYPVMAADPKDGENVQSEEADNNYYAKNNARTKEDK